MIVEMRANVLNATVFRCLLDPEVLSKDLAEGVERWKEDAAWQVGVPASIEGMQPPFEYLITFRLLL